MKKFLTAFLGLGVALSSMADMYENYTSVPLVEFEVTPEVIGTDPGNRYYRWRNPEDPKFTIFSTYTSKYISAANSSYLYHNFRPFTDSEPIGYIDIAGRTMNLYTEPATETTTGVLIPSTPNLHFIKYDDEDGSFKFENEKYCYILVAKQFDGDVVEKKIVLDAYEFEGHYGGKNYEGPYPNGDLIGGTRYELTVDDIAKPWYLKFKRIEDMEFDNPKLEEYSGYNTSLTAHPNQENRICCWDVVARYYPDTKTLRVYNIQGYNTEIAFNVDLATGRATGKGDPISTMWGDVFFSDLDKKDFNLHGTLQNTEDGKCIFKINPWGLLLGDGTVTTFNRYYDGKIVLNTHIDGLCEEPSDEEPGQGDVGTATGKGEMTVDVDNDKDRHFEVTAEFKNGLLTINNFGGSKYPISFNVDLKTGDLISMNKMQGAVYDDTPYFFTDNAKKDFYVYGHIDNSTDKEESVMTADTWTYGTTRPGVLEIFSNTRIVFDFKIPGLKDESGNDDPGKDDPGKDDPGKDDPGTDDPGTDDPGNDDPGTDDPGTDDPGTDDPGDSGIGEVGSDSAEVRYFNLQGIEIKEPAKGTICIKVEGNKATKVLTK